MTIIQLEYFCAVCRCRSITKAADELFVSQPTISIAIKNLEEEYSTRFLNHNKNSISLTKEGAEFYKKAQALLNQFQDLNTEYSDPSIKKTPLKVGIPPLMSMIFFPKIIDAFCNKYDVPVHLYEYGSSRARNLVMDDTLDIALVNMDFYNIDTFNSYIMMSDEYVYVVSRNHPLAKRKTVSLEELGQENIIFFNTDSVQNKIFTSKFLALHINPNIIMYSSQLNTILNFVKKGTCGAFLFSQIAIDSNDFIKLKITPAIKNNFGIIWKKGTYTSLRTQRFIEFIKNTYKKEP